MNAELSSPSRSYRAFSPSRIWTLATNTLTQLVRMKILFFLGVFVAIILFAAFVLPVRDPVQQLRELKVWGFGSFQIFSLVMAIAATALLLPRDVEDRTLYTILSKPVPRHEYLVGKLLGVLLLLGCGMLLMDVVFSGVIWLKQSIILKNSLAALAAEKSDTSENVAFWKSIVAQNGLTWSLHWAVWCIFLKAAVISALALLMSCIASSTLFTILVSLCFAAAGQGEALLRSFVLKGMTVFWKKACAFALAIFCPDLGLFDQTQAVIDGHPISFLTLAETTGFGIAYIVLYAGVANLIFSEKEL